MEPLITTNNRVEYLIEFTSDNFEYSINFNIHEVISWTGETNEIYDKELYLKGEIKWDGCSHFWFGEDGYIHMCGKDSFEDHKKVFDAVWELASKKIKGWDPC